MNANTETKEQTVAQTNPWVTPSHLLRLAVVYMRQSTEEQVRENTGSAQFQRDLVDVAREYGWPQSQIQIIASDLGKSGSTTEGRTGLEQLHKMIEANQVGAVFVANISRIGRQVLDVEFFRLQAALHDVLLYSDGRFINPADPNDTILTQINSIFAQFENKKRAEIMMQSRMSKAQRGEVVSRLPVGWVKGADGKYDYDRETEDTIRMIIDMFWRTRAIRRTVIALGKAGIKIPSRKKHGRLYWAKPTLSRVTFILTHPAYTGTYIFAKSQSQPGGAVLASGQTKCTKLPEARWVKHPDHFPAYMTPQEQAEIKSILATNQFKRRFRAGRGRALTQGLLRCSVCGATLAVSYSRKGHYFACRRSREYAEKPCMSFDSNDLDESILREVFKVLKAPPVAMLKAALAASRTKKQTRTDWIRSERERFAHEELLAQEQADLSYGKLPGVHFAALEKLEKVLQETKQFEERIALEQLTPSNDESEEELEELCRIASELPSLWRHEAVTHKERKEILRCLVDYIVVAASREKLDATICWKSGAKTSISVWRPRSHHHLIRELHAEKLTAQEIKERLAAGKTSTGQVVDISLGGIQMSLSRMGLKAAKLSAVYLATRQKAVELDREGQSVNAIARYFNEKGFASPSGKPWTHFMVEHLLRANGQTQESLANIHRRAINEARARGLSHEQMAEEFNKRNIRRRGGLRWTAKSIATRWSDLNRMRLNNEDKESAKTGMAELVLLKRSA